MVSMSRGPVEHKTGKFSSSFLFSAAGSHKERFANVNVEEVCHYHASSLHLSCDRLRKVYHFTDSA